MRQRIRSSLSAGLVITVLCVHAAWGVPASPDPIELSQPGGARFIAYVRGDEFQGWVETEKGYTVVKNAATGAWEYATRNAAGALVPSGVVVKPDADGGRTLSHHLMPDRRAPDAVGLEGANPEEPELLAGQWNPVPVSGSRRLLIILVQFANRSLITTASGWNGTTFSTTAGAKSVVNFYKDNSFNALAVEPVSHSQAGNPPGLVTVTVANNHPNCGNDFNYSVEVAWINAALAQAANYVSFPALDTNGDGTLQTSEVVVYFILAGYEASGSSNTPNIWAHAWGGSGVSVSGKSVTRWALNGELNHSSAQHPMGVIAHELGHSMCGLPDLYDTSNTNSGLGAFSLMASGSWGRTSYESYSGTTPVALDAWSRQYAGWALPRVPSSSGPMSFGPALSSQDAPVKLIDESLSTTQYFMVENRYPVGWDEGLERYLGTDWGGGLLIEHVDITVGTPGYNNINTYVAGGHQGVMAEEASTVYCSLVNGTSCRGHVTLLFYSGNNANFDNSTTPNSKLYDGTSTPLAVTGVSARAQTMTANVQVPTPAVLANATDVTVFEGGTKAFQVKLGKRPASDVTVSVSRLSGDADLAVQSGASLTFTASNWNVYQTVILSAAQDADVCNGQAVFRCSAVDMVSSDVTATEQDNDTLAIVTDTAAATVPEGATASFQVRLNAPPCGEVVVSVTRADGDGDIAVQSGVSLAFTETDWDVYQTVTLAAYADADACDGQATIRCSATGVADKNITATEQDADRPSFVTDRDAVTLTEGGTATFEVKLSGPPCGELTAAMTRVSGTSVISVQSGASLPFTTTNWDTYQTVTLYSAYDTNLHNDQATIRCSAQGAAYKDITATQQDDHVGGDLDGDSDVDLLDFGSFQGCFGGPNRPWPYPGCELADMDGDDDVDLTDFAGFQGCFNGPNRPPACY